MASFFAAIVAVTGSLPRVQCHAKLLMRCFLLTAGSALQAEARRQQKRDRLASFRAQLRERLASHAKEQLLPQHDDQTEVSTAYV